MHLALYKLIITIIIINLINIKRQQQQFTSDLSDASRTLPETAETFEEVLSNILP